MSLPMDSDSQSFVLLRLGERRFALAAKNIAELVAPTRVFRFPHQTPEIEGVILRRGRIVPVCDVAERLIGKSLKSRRLYLIALRRYAGQAEWIALPVTGECELITTEMSPASDADSPHVAGWLSHAGDVIEVLNLDGLTPGPTELVAPAAPLEAEEARP
jgi:chemotaxis signal transduction protein